jgi:hypothetical protein
MATNRVRCGIVAYGAWMQSSRSNSLCLGKGTIVASCPAVVSSSARSSGASAVMDEGPLALLAAIFWFRPRCAVGFFERSLRPLHRRTDACVVAESRSRKASRHEGAV